MRHYLSLFYKNRDNNRAEIITIPTSICFTSGYNNMVNIVEIKKIGESEEYSLCMCRIFFTSSSKLIFKMKKLRKLVLSLPKDQLLQQNQCPNLHFYSFAWFVVILIYSPPAPALPFIFRSPVFLSEGGKLGCRDRAKAGTFNRR